jgi:hypothetical protein
MFYSISPLPEINTVDMHSGLVVCCLIAAGALWFLFSLWEGETIVSFLMGVIVALTSFVSYKSFTTGVKMTPENEVTTAIYDGLEGKYYQTTENASKGRKRTVHHHDMYVVYKIEDGSQQRITVKIAPGSTFHDRITVYRNKENYVQKYCIAKSCS